MAENSEDTDRVKACLHEIAKMLGVSVSTFFDDVRESDHHEMRELWALWSQAKHPNDRGRILALLRQHACKLN